MKTYFSVFGTWTSTVLVLSFISTISTTVNASSARFSPYQMEMAPTSAERPFSVKLLNLIQRRRVGKNARMDTESPDSMSLLKSTGSILKSLVKMAAAASETQPTMRMERKSSRFFPTSESESSSSRANKNEGRPVRRIRKSRVLFPTDDGSFSTNNNFDNSLSNDNSRLPIWPQTLQSRNNEQRPNNFRQGIITRVSRPTQNDGVIRQEDLITRLTNPLLYKSSYLVPSSSREGEVVAIKQLPPSVIRSQPLTVEIGPGTTRDGRKLKTVEVQGVKIIIGEPRLNDPYDKYFKFNPSSSLN